MSLSHRGKETGAQRDDCLSSIRLHCSGREWILHYSRSQSSHLQDGVASLHPVALAWNQNDVLYFIKVASQVALEVKNPSANAEDIRDVGLIPGLGRFPWRRAWQPTPVFLPGESHGQRSLVGYSSWAHRVRHNCSNLAYSHTHTHTLLSCIRCWTQDMETKV